MLYYIIRNAESDSRVLAIHQVIHSVMAVFNRMIMKDTFVGYLEVVRVTTDEYGMTVSERIIHSYSSTSGVLVSHQMVNGVLIIQSANTSPTLSIRAPSRSPGYFPRTS